MLYEKTLAIPLRHRPFKDHHKVLTFFTRRYGLIHAVGYGMGYFGSKRSGAFDLMNLCEADFVHKRNVWSIHAGQPIKTHSSIKKNLEKSALALKSALFLSMHLPVELPNKPLFDLFIDLLNVVEKTLSSSSLDLEFLSAVFQSRALYLLGHFPDLKSSKCRCKVAQNTAYFILLDPFSIKCSICLRKSSKKISAQTLDELFEITERPLSESAAANYSAHAKEILAALVRHFSENPKSQ